MVDTLVTKAKNGDVQALNELINNHKELAYSIALKYLQNNEDAKDVVQNSFLIVLQSLKKYRNEAKFSTWLYKIVYHECLKELKRRDQYIEYTPVFLQNETDDIKPENINIENLLKVLKPKEYTVITLFYLKEKSIKDISEITSISNSNVKVLLHRARTKIKKSTL